MNILKNKFFLLGNLAFLLIVIPVVLYFVSNQTSTQGEAAATTTMSFNPSSMTVDQCTSTQTTRLMLNPVDNIVATVQLALKWDKTKFDIEFQPNTDVFKQVLSGPEQTTDGLSVTLNIGTDVSNAISTATEVGTITIKPLLPTGETPINLEILASGTKVFSFAEEVSTENVYDPSGSSPFRLLITAATCNNGSPTPTPTNPAGGASPSPSTSPTQQANTAPVCQNLLASTASGSAPLSVTFTATGGDANGTIPKATFNFGDGSQQDVTTGLGTASVSAQLSHTYSNGGNFNATVVFTDNSGAVSATCTKTITVAGAIATIAPLPTATPTMPPTATPVPPTAIPTVEAPGGIGQSVGIIGGVILTIIAGIFLLSL